MPFAAIWMDLEMIILSELSQAEKDKHHVISKTEVVVQSLSCIQLFTYMDGSMPGSAVLYCLLEYTQIHVH